MGIFKKAKKIVKKPFKAAKAGVSGIAHPLRTIKRGANKVGHFGERVLGGVADALTPDIPKVPGAGQPIGPQGPRPLYARPEGPQPGTMQLGGNSNPRQYIPNQFQGKSGGAMTFGGGAPQGPPPMPMPQMAPSPMPPQAPMASPSQAPMGTWNGKPITPGAVQPSGSGAMSALGQRMAPMMAKTPMASPSVAPQGQKVQDPRAMISALRGRVI